MKIFNFGEIQQAKQMYIEKHLELLAYMAEAVANKAPHVSLDESVYQAYIEHEGTRFSIACDAFGYQVSALVAKRYERIIQFEALAPLEVSNKHHVFYEVACHVLNDLSASKKEKKIS